jgi:hypothetical protein
MGVIGKDPDILGGIPLFRGMRVPKRCSTIWRVEKHSKPFSRGFRLCRVKWRSLLSKKAKHLLLTRP